MSLFLYFGILSFFYFNCDFRYLVINSTERIRSEGKKEKRMQNWGSPKSQMYRSFPKVLQKSAFKFQQARTQIVKDASR